MSERPAPVVSAEQMRARLAEIERTRTASAATSRVPSPVIGPFRRRCRERVVLLDYFEVVDLTPTASSDGRPPADDSDVPFLMRIRSVLFDRHRDGHPKQASSGEQPGPIRPRTPEETELNDFATHDCEVVTTRLGPRWRLVLPVRQKTLAILGPAGALDVVRRPDAIPAGDDDVTHRMARRLLEGQRELSGRSATELSGILRAVDWLTGLGLDLPTLPSIRGALDLANVLAPLRAVETDDFVGRETELALIHEHLTGPTQGRLLALAIHGPGGVGKSTLLSRFVLDHVERTDCPLLFSYLSFDRGELDVQYPLTLLSETCRQIALQSPPLVDALARVRLQIDEVLTAQMAFHNEATTGRGRGYKDVERHRADEAVVAGHFAEVVNSASGGAPVLLVLDTFEMAQRKRGSSLPHLNGALQRMQQRMPSLRVVIAGRAEVKGLSVHNTPLKGLDKVQARALLVGALRGLDIDPGLVDLVVSRVSGNPLSLRLAADLMKREGPAVLGSRRGRRRLLFDLRAEQVQGVLYRRILDHVDKRVRPLANPGLVVRQITSDVILQVLAEPCGLHRLTEDRAGELFDLLGAEASLVTEARPGVLVHRADVRREMLPLLQAEDPDRVVDIHRRAVHYYVHRTEINDQIEHLYHRLMLGQSSRTLDEHWVDAATKFLEDAWDELPPESRVYLAGRLHVEADPADLLAADQTAWVRQATRQARALLEAGQPGPALTILRAKQTSPQDLGVSRLIVESLAAQGNDQEALGEAEAAIAEADAQGLGLESVQLNILAGRIAEDGHATKGVGSSFVAARRHYLDARTSAIDFGARAEGMTAGVGALRVSRRFGGFVSDVPRDQVAALPAWPEPQYDTELRPTLTAEAAALTDHELATHPGLLRELAAELGSELPALLIAAATHVGVETEGASASRMPEASQSRLRGTVTSRGFLPSEPYPTMAGLDSGDHAERAIPVTSHTTGTALADALRTSPGDDELKDSLSGYWQREVDRPSYDYDEDSKKGDAK